MKDKGYNTITNTNDSELVYYMDKLAYKEVGGYCCAWSYFIMDARLSDLKTPAREFTQKLIDGVKDKQLNFWNVIKTFTNGLQDDLKNILASQGLTTDRFNYLYEFRGWKKDKDDKLPLKDEVRNKELFDEYRDELNVLMKTITDYTMKEWEKSITNIDEIKDIQDEILQNHNIIWNEKRDRYIKKYGEEAWNDKLKADNLKEKKKREKQNKKVKKEKEKEERFKKRLRKEEEKRELKETGLSKDFTLARLQKEDDDLTTFMTAVDVEFLPKVIRKANQFIKFKNKIETYATLGKGKDNPEYKKTYDDFTNELEVLIEVRDERLEKEGDPTITELDDDELDFGKKKKKPIPLVDIRWKIKSTFNCIQGYKKFFKNTEKKDKIKKPQLDGLKSLIKIQTNNKFDVEKLTGKEVLDDVLIDLWNEDNCPKEFNLMSRAELEEYARINNIDIGDSIRGLAPRKDSGDVFKPLLQLTGVKKAYTQKEQEEFMKKQKKQINPFETYKKQIQGMELTGKEEKLNLIDKQDTFIRKMIYSNYRGALAYWSVGTGKTILASMTIKTFLHYYPEGNVVFIAPSALLSNIVETLFSIGLDIRDTRLKFYSYEKYARIKQICKNTLLIIDEAHNLRTYIQPKENKQSDDFDDDEPPQGNDKYKHIPEEKIRWTGGRAKAVIDNCSQFNVKTLLLSATPFINTPYDVENLLAMIDGRLQLQKGEYFNIINSKKDNEDYFRYRVSHYQRAFDNKDFPKKNEFILDFKMTEQENEDYMKIAQSADPALKAYYIGTRQIINQLGDFKKLREVVNHLREAKVKFEDEGKPPQFIIYMAFIQKGIAPLSNLLNGLNPEGDKKENEPISFAVVSGEEGASQKQESVSRYNSGQVNVMIISRAGAEGLDLKNTANIYILDQPWNEATREQVIGRGVRYKSHASLPEKFRYVNVYNTFFINNEEIDLLEKVRKIKDDKTFSLILNLIKEKQAEEKSLTTTESESQDKQRIWMSAEDLAKAKSLGMTSKEYYNKVAFNRYATERKIAEEFNPPANTTIDLFLYIYSKSKQHTINEFVDYLINDIPSFEKGISPAEQEIMDRLEAEEPKTPEEKEKVYEEVLTKYVRKGQDLITKNADLSNKTLEKLDAVKNKTTKTLNKIKNVAYQQFNTSPEHIKVMYDMSNIENEPNKELLILEPTAGRGDIIQFLLEKLPQAQFRATEFDKKVRKKLTEYITTIGHNPEEVIYKEPNFLRLTPSDRFNYVFMNPPFNINQDEITYKEKVFDLDFVQYAFSLLKPNGTLVALIYSPHLKPPRGQTKSRLNELAEWVSDKRLFKSHSITKGSVKWEGALSLTDEETETAIQEIERLPIAYIKLQKKDFYDLKDNPNMSDKIRSMNAERQNYLDEGYRNKIKALLHPKPISKIQATPVAKIPYLLDVVDDDEEIGVEIGMDDFFKLADEDFNIAHELEDFYGYGNEPEGLKEDMRKDAIENIKKSGVKGGDLVGGNVMNNEKELREAVVQLDDDFKDMKEFTEKKIHNEIHDGSGYEKVYSKYEKAYQNVKDCLDDINDIINEMNDNPKKTHLKKQLEKMKDKFNNLDKKIENHFEKHYIMEIEMKGGSVINSLPAPAYYYNHLGVPTRKYQKSQF